MSPDVFAEEWHAAFSRVHRSQSNCYPLGTATEDFEFCDVMDDLALLGLSSSDEIDGAFGQSDWDEEYNWNIGC